jgi:predicted phosphoadenosine phosphosulfate sulfurtransferase
VKAVAEVYGMVVEGYGGAVVQACGGGVMMRTSHLLIHPLHLQWDTYKDLSLELVPSNLTIRYFRFLELFLTYMRI